SITGTRRFGLSAPNSSVSSPPNGPPASMRSCGRPSSPTAHITFCTLIELRRPQTFSMPATPAPLREGCDRENLMLRVHARRGLPDTGGLAGVRLCSRHVAVPFAVRVFGVGATVLGTGLALNPIRRDHEIGMFDIGTRRVDCGCARRNSA